MVVGYENPSKPNVCITEPQRIYNGTPRHLCLCLGIERAQEVRKLKSESRKK